MKSRKEKLREYHRNWRQRNKEHIKERNKRWRDNNPERVKKLRDEYWSKHKEEINAKRRAKLDQVTRRYGLTTEQYFELLEKQNGVCAICKLPPKPNERLAVDHCHSTNKVRGLLHRKCNVLLGMCNDSTSILKNAIEYLEEYAESKSDTSET